MVDLSWDNDLAFGDAGEMAVFNLIRDAEAEITTGFFKEYDIKLSDGRTVEVKTDAKMHRTGNHLVECGCDGKGSGIAVTSAEWWVVLDGELAYFCNTDDIKAEGRGREQINWVSWQGKNMKGVLINKISFLPLCRRIYPCKVDISGR